DDLDSRLSGLSFFSRRASSRLATCSSCWLVILIQTFVSSALVTADDFAGAGDAELLPLLLSSSALAPDARMARDGRGFSAAGSSFAAAGAVGAAGGAGFSFVFLSSSLSSSLALTLTSFSFRAKSASPRSWFRVMMRSDR
ncbi:unnamed protein product, partial [Ixodes pacificus]